MGHRKKIKHFHNPGDLHEFTFSCYERRQMLVDDEYRRQLSRSIDKAGEAEQIDLVAFVYMPEHVHLLVRPRTDTPKLGTYLARIKQPFSAQVKELLIAEGSPLVEDLTIRERPDKLCFRYWQEGAGYDRNVYSPSAIRGSIDYIHANPVRRGVCASPVEWKWSSARYYLLDPPRQQFPDLPHIHGLSPGVLD